MQKILKWFIPILSIGVAIFIIFFIISINSEEKFTSTTELSLLSTKIKNQETNNWLKHFSKIQRLGYYYPVNEVYIKVDLNEKITKTITYKLSAPLLDPYQLFCLKEELNHHRLKYDLQKSIGNVELVIYSTNKKRLNSLVRVLRNYQIVAEIVPYKEEIK